MSQVILKRHQNYNSVENSFYSSANFFLFQVSICEHKLQNKFVQIVKKWNEKFAFCLLDELIFDMIFK